jgi:hypothetical protein
MSTVFRARTATWRVLNRSLVLIAGAMLFVAPSSAAAQQPARTDSTIAADRATPRAAPRGDRFYHNIAWGSESEFNPLTEVLNEGFNDMVIESSDMRLFGQPYGASWTNLVHNLSNVVGSFKHYGWPLAVRNELLPLTGFEGGQWVPNYTDHLLGCGMVSVRLEEWYRDHGYAAPFLLSAATMMTAHLTNEIIERPRYWTVDPLADLLVFDPMGMLLFRSDAVQRFFSGPMQLMNWAGQPMMVFPYGRLENASEEFKFTLGRPKAKRWRAFLMTGLDILGGVTYTGETGRSISVGIGRGSDVAAIEDSVKDVRTVNLGARAGIFYDRDGSLLASLIYNGSNDGLFVINVYPGVLHVGSASPGVWLDVRRNGVRFGVAAPLGVGIGYGAVQPK